MFILVVMNGKGYKSQKYNLIAEMFETVNLVRNFKLELLSALILKSKEHANWMITGEGSSRIFPAKNLLYHRLMYGIGPEVYVSDASLLLNVNHSGYLVFGASNSGKTKELIQLFEQINMPDRVIAISSHTDTPLKNLASTLFFTDFCNEKAVAATQSVVCQALVYDLLLANFIGRSFDLDMLANIIQDSLETAIPDEAINALAMASHVYYVGADNGVAEEIALKHIEVVQKPSSFLQGTLLLHGVEEVVTANDALVIFDMQPVHFERISKIYIESIGAKVIVIGQSFPGCISVPTGKTYEAFFEGYQKLCLGWNILAKTGLQLGVNIDKPQRARKIGNSFY